MDPVAFLSVTVPRRGAPVFTRRGPPAVPAIDGIHRGIEVSMLDRAPKIALVEPTGIVREAHRPRPRRAVA